MKESNQSVSEFRIHFSYLFVCLLTFGTGLHAQFLQSNSELGIQHHYTSFVQGAGVSLVDFNGDGRDDITLATGNGQLLGLYAAQQDGMQAIYPIGLEGLDEAVRSINWVDYDNDGDKDLFVTVWEPTLEPEFQNSLKLYRQDAGFEFADVTIESGIISENPLSYGSVWADYDNDGFLDLYVCGYDYPEDANHLFHNQGDGTFEDVAEDLGMTDLQGRSFTSVFFDADLDGNIDLFTANDREGSFNTFYRGLGEGVYEDQSIESGLYTEFDAMGVDVGDYDNDGDLDLYVTNTATPNPDSLVGGVLFQNSGDATFTPFGNFPQGTDFGTFWGCNFIDFDYDRDLDLFTVAHDATGDQHSRMFFVNNGSGEYTDYPGDEFNGETIFLSGVAIGDVDDDGVLDIVALGLFEGNSSEIWIGPQTTNNHIAIRLEGTISNRDGIGAIIEVWIDGEKRMDQTSSANSFASQDSDNYRFGIGQAALVDSVIIRWPSGLINMVEDVPAGAQLDLLESDIVILDCLPSADIMHQLIPGPLQTFSLVDLVNVDSLDIQWTVEGEFVGTGMEIDHTFDSLGTYTVCANITASCASYDLCEVFDIACQEPVASYSLLLGELQIQVEDSSYYSDEVTWFLDGDQVGNGTSLEVQFDEPGVFMFCQVVTNACGTDSLCEQITVTCTTPLPEILWSSPADLTLNASLDQSYDSVLWVISNEIVEGPILELSFMEGGFYELCAFVWDQCGVDSTCVLVEIACETPIADFTWTQDSLEVQVIDLTAGDTVLWTLNGEPLLLSAELSFELPSAGDYALCAEVIDSCGVALYCDSIFVDFTSGFAEYSSLEDHFEFWPNPVQEVLHIRSKVPIMLHAMIDLSGRRIETDQNLGQSLEFDLKLSHIEPGVYCLILEGASGSQYPIFFIKGRP